MMASENMQHEAQPQRKQDAVETAIDIAKSSRRSTWEEAVGREPHRIPRWSEHPTSEPVASGQAEDDEP
jgi:hypothetical protein